MADDKGEGGRSPPRASRRAARARAARQGQEGQGRGRRRGPHAQGTRGHAAAAGRTTRRRCAASWPRSSGSPTRTRCRGWRRSCSTSAWATRARTRSSSRPRSRSWALITGQQAGRHPGQEGDRELRSPRGHAGRRVGDAPRRADVRVPGPLHHPGDPPDPRLPRAAQPELRRAGELHLRHQGADDLPRDRLRQGREDPRDGHHDRDVDRPATIWRWRCCASWAGRSAARRLRKWRERTTWQRLSWIERAKRTPKFKVRAVRRCQRCGRARAVLRKFGLCRICFRELALKGEIPGVRKASW